MPCHQHFRPHANDARPCWHCRHYGGLMYQGSAAWCLHPGSARVRAMPADGCAAFGREPGADDEPGPPTAGLRGP